MKPSIFIGLPNLGKINTSLSRRLRQWHCSPEYSITLAEATGIYPLEVAVNQLLSTFLKTDNEWLFLINADECLPVDALDRLLAHDVDVVAPLGLRWSCTKGPLPCVGVLEGGGDDELARHFENQEGVQMSSGRRRYVQPTDGYTGLRRCDRIGNSGMLLKRHVVESLPLGTYRLEMNDERTEVYGSEDFVWCDAIRAAGFEIWVDCDLILDHFKEVNLSIVTKLLLEAQEKGRQDTVKALKRLREAGATDTEAIESIVEYFDEKIRNV
jgi:hypothetical protein